MTSRSEIHGIFSIATSFPESWARTDVEKTAVSCGFPCTCTRKMQCRSFAKATGSATSSQSQSAQKVFMPIDKGFDRICNVCCLTRS